jgi:hypothetical protein
VAAISETIVREYFELHGFLVRQYRKHVAPAGRDDQELDFLALNPDPVAPQNELPFVLSSAELPFIQRSVVVIKAWHTEVFSPALLAKAPELFRFLENKSFQRVVRSFGKNGISTKLMVVPALPQENQQREESIHLLRSKGIDAVIPFRTMLADLVSQVEANRNYQKSDVLQLIRILKNYDFLKSTQLELFKPKQKRAGRVKAIEAIQGGEQ